MCLDIAFERKSGRKTGYKLLVKTGEKYFTCLSPAKKIELNKREYVEDIFPLRLFLGNSKVTYLSGFHIFLNRKDAQFISKFYKVVVCKVAFLDETSFGEVKWSKPEIDETLNRVKVIKKIIRTKTVVARKCKILKELR